MSALTQTAANVQFSAGAARFPGSYNFGATIAAGQPIYLDANRLWQLADADVALGAADVQAYAGNSGSAGQRCDAIIADDDFTHGLTATAVGDTIWNSPTAGSFTKTIADLVTGVFTTACMIITSATKAKLFVVRSGVAHV